MRFFLLTEHDLQYHVLPSGVFPFEEVEVMLSMMRKERERIRGLAYYVHNPALQGTPRPRLLRIVHFGVKLVDLLKEQRLLYTKSTDERSIACFTVNKLCHMRRISSASIVDEGGGTLTVTTKRGFLATQKWIHCSSTFDQPLVLYPNVPYDFKCKNETALTNEECSVRMKKTVGGVTFEGLSYCTSFTLEFITAQPESDSESSESDDNSGLYSSDGTDNSGLYSSDGTDNMETVHEVEDRMAEVHLAAAEKESSLAGGSEGVNDGNQDGTGGSVIAAANEVNNRGNDETGIKIAASPIVLQGLLDDAMKEDLS